MRQQIGQPRSIAESERPIAVPGLP